MYIGSYQETIRENGIQLGFDLQSRMCSIFCIEWGEDEITVVICPPDVEDAEAYYGSNKILESRKEMIGDSLILPQAFLTYMGEDREVTVLGINDRIEILKKGYFNSGLPDSEEMDAFIRELTRKMEE
ncbi:MAG: hypothetical protein IJE10_02825 [Clostridia bacterium]|nr:hypothetical protein [Clostridia bacterium]